MGVLFSFLSSLPVILTVLFTVAKTFPRVFYFFRHLFGASRGGIFRSGVFGIILSILVFAGGLGLISALVYNFSLENLIFVIDKSLIPFSSLLSKFLTMILTQSGGCPPMPNAFSVFLGVLHLPLFVGIVVSSICCEVFIRFFIHFLIKRAG